MSYLDATIPTDNEAVKIGASRIRSLKQQLNSVLGQIFTDAGAFLSKWVQQSHLADAAVGETQVADSAITTAKLAPGVLSADAAGRARMADGFLTPEKLDPAFALPNGSVATAALANAAVTGAKIADAAIGFNHLVTGIVKASIGTYAGSDSSSQNIHTLPFKPDALVITGGRTSHKVCMSFLAESQNNLSPLHACWLSDTIGSTFGDAIQWQDNGFLVLPTNFAANSSGVTHVYLALKL